MSPSIVEEAKSKNNVIHCPFIATDIIIEYDRAGVDGIVLIERKNKPYGIALPGGFQERWISLGANCVKEAKEETGLEVIVKDETHPYHVASDPARDPRAHVIALTYIAKGYGTICAGDDAKEAFFVSLDELPEYLSNKQWAFPDHRKRVEEYYDLHCLDFETSQGKRWAQMRKDAETK